MSTSSPTASRDPSARVELGQGPAEGIVVRTRHGEQQSGRRGDRETLGRREAAWAGVLRGQEGPHRVLGHLDLHEGVRRVGRRAAAGRQLELGHQFLLAHAEAPRRVGDGASPTWASHPTTASSRRSRRLVSAPGAARRAGAAASPAARLAAHRRRHARMASGRERCGPRPRAPRARRPARPGRRAARSPSRGRGGRAPTSGWRRTTRRRARARPTRRRAGAPPCPGPPHRPPAGLQASTRIRMSTRSSPSASHGSSGRAASTSTSSGTSALAGLAARHLALDPVHPERAHGVTLQVPGHQVPVPESEPQPDRRDPARSRRGRRTPRWPACARPRTAR